MEPEEFYKHVLEVARLVPKGRVTTYGAIAKCIGGGTARMAGRAMGFADDDSIPAHRIVNAAGRISGHSTIGVNHRIDALASEGIIVNNGKIANFKQVFWDPLKEIEL